MKKMPIKSGRVFGWAAIALTVFLLAGTGAFAGPDNQELNGDIGQDLNRGDESLTAFRDLRPARDDTLIYVTDRRWSWKELSACARG